MDAAYLKEWKNRRAQAAFILRMLDVRVFELSPNVSLSAIRAFGDEELRQTLKLQKVSESSAAESLLKAPFIQAMIDPGYSRSPYSKATDQQASHEYRRMQAHAGADDKKMNKALAAAIEAALAQSGIQAAVEAEKQAKDGNLKPDVQVTLPSGKIYCLEPTWRSTGKGIPDELGKGRTPSPLDIFESISSKRCSDTSTT